MDITYEKNRVFIRGLEFFDPKDTFDCGQCFRFNPISENTYHGVAFSRVLTVEKTGTDTIFHCSQQDFEQIWYEYFDLGTDYNQLRNSFEHDPYMKKAAEFGAGIRILKQEPWEALCSFIISQCNNISRIKNIVENFCRLFGRKLELKGEIYHAFPAAQTVAGLTCQDLAPLRAGYRDKFIINAAKQVASGRLDLDSLKSVELVQAKKRLLELDGVGEKVASCVLLFGLEQTEAFPVDVWVGRAIKEFYGGKSFDISQFGRHAGLAQQYIFNYIRNNK